MKSLGSGGGGNITPLNSIYLVVTGGAKNPSEPSTNGSNSLSRLVGSGTNTSQIRGASTQVLIRVGLGRCDRLDQQSPQQPSRDRSQESLLATLRLGVLRVLRLVRRGLKC